MSEERMPGIVEEWLNTSFSGGRHIARVNALDRLIPVSDNENTERINIQKFQFTMALSIRETFFGPVLFSGRTEEGFSKLYESGFKYVELSVRNEDDIPGSLLRELLDKYELKVSAIATGQG